MNNNYINSVITKINNIVSNSYNVIKNTADVKLRKRIINLNDVAYYYFKISEKNASNVSVVENIILENNIMTTSSAQSLTSSLYKKERNFSIDGYKYIFNELINLLHDISSKYPILKANNMLPFIYTDTIIKNIETFSDSHIFIGIDGSCASRYGEKSTSITDNPITFYDINNGIPIKMTQSNNNYFINNKKNLSDKNNESVVFIDYINEHYLELIKMYPNKKIVFIFDRAYFCANLMNTLDKYKFEYIFRIKNNSKMINNKKYRVVSNNTIGTSSFEHEKDVYEYDYYEQYNLFTSLSNDKFDDDMINYLYSLRWTIEVYFRHLKDNTKFGFNNTKFKCKIEKFKYVNMTIFIIAKIMLFLYHISTNFKSPSLMKNKNTYYKINISKLMRGIYKYMLNTLFYDKFNITNIKKYFSVFIEIKSYAKNRKFRRVAIMSIYKWYYKSYSNSTFDKRIVLAIIENNVNELNKNEKSKSNKIIKSSIKKNNKYLFDENG